MFWFLQILYEGKKKSTSGSESSDTTVPDGGDVSAAEGGPSVVSEGGDSTAITEETEEGTCCVTMATRTHAHMCAYIVHTPFLLPPSPTCIHINPFSPLPLSPTHTTH